MLTLKTAHTSCWMLASEASQIEGIGLRLGSQQEDDVETHDILQLDGVSFPDNQSMMALARRFRPSADVPEKVLLLQESLWKAARAPDPILRNENPIEVSGIISFPTCSFEWPKQTHWQCKQRRSS